jgi:peptidoglycan hydrolase-like protein with peptidoglycan-binding domain
MRLDRGRDEDSAGLGARLAFLRNIGWGPRDAIAFTVGALGSVAILVNALFLQTGPHPAPLFKAPVSAVAAAEATNTVVAVPRARPPEPAPAKVEALPRTPAEIMSEVQRELVRRGFYDGAIDGVHGPKTDAAIRDFEQAAGMKLSLQANEALLQTMVKSSIAAPKTATTVPTPPAAPVSATTGSATTGSATTASAATASAATASAAGAGHGDAIGDMLASSRRVIGLQRALAQYGYGQIKPTGMVDAETRAAIEKFERERKLPVTGQPSERVARELAGLTGRPLD